MRLFSHKNRMPWQGAYPTELLSRDGLPNVLPDVLKEQLAKLKTDYKMPDTLAGEPLNQSMNDFMCLLDSVREGHVNASGSDIPDCLTERSRHLKAAAYFLDSSIVGVCSLDNHDLLKTPRHHSDLAGLAFSTAREKLRLRFNPEIILRQIEVAREAMKTSPTSHRFAVLIAVEFPRDPDPNEPGAGWILNAQEWRAAVRANETALVMANYLRILGYDARSHSATTTDFDLAKLAVKAGIAAVDEKGGLKNPMLGSRFGLAAISTSLELEPDQPLASTEEPSPFSRAGLSWRTGWSAPKRAGTHVDFHNRPYRDSRFPTEKLKRVEKTTNFIDEARVPRSPKSSEFFLRAAFGDLGPGPLEVSKDGYAVSKEPFAAALRLALNVYSLIQRGDPAPEKAAGYDDAVSNAEMMKATMHFLGADLSGVSKAPDWVWYSHRQDGSEMPVAHPNAVSVMIDQGYETMEGASGDDWISSAQSMRTYMRASLYCSIVAHHLRGLGFDSSAHSAADSDVVQTPLVLLAGLGEVSRIGETILNPFLGPRLKTGILTTDLPMEADLPIDFGLQKFCGNCNKCARECPSGAISAGPKVMFNGYEIWKADVEKCTRYRTTNMGGAMCGRCMKTCPWNLSGLVKEAPFRWAAQTMPWAAKWIAMADDMLNRGTINPVKKWWWDLVNKGGKFVKADTINARGLNKHINLKHEDQTLACYPINLVPEPLPKPNPVDREAGIEAYGNLKSPKEYQDQLATGKTKGLVGELAKVSDDPAVFVGKLKGRRASSADGKIDIFEIISRDGSPMPKFTAGAHVDITVTPQFIRQFSLAGDPADTDTYLLGVLREDEGRGGSLKIHQMLQEGTAVVVSKPRNHFPIMSEAKRHLLLAGGIGVTPLIAMGHELYRQGEDFILYYKARTRAQAAFIPELEAVEWRDHVKFHFSDEDRLDIETVLTDYRRDDHLYTCGPSAFMDAIFETAERHGWPEDALHREYFSVPDGLAYENHDFQLKLRSSGQTVTVRSDQAATEALADIGIEVDVKCSDGLCGVCATPYVEGDVEHRDYVLSKQQRQEKMILCCSRASKAGGEIVLDL